MEFGQELLQKAGLGKLVLDLSDESLLFSTRRLLTECEETRAWLWSRCAQSIPELEVEEALAASGLTDFLKGRDVFERPARSAKAKAGSFGVRFAACVPSIDIVGYGRASGHCSHLVCSPLSSLQNLRRLYRDALRRMRTQAEIAARLSEESANQFVRTLNDLANHPLVAIDAAMELHGGSGTGSPFQVMRFSPAETPGESAKLVPSDGRIARSKTAFFLGELKEAEGTDDATADAQRPGNVRRAVTLASGMDEKALGKHGTSQPLLAKQGSGYVRMGSGLSQRAEGSLLVSPTTSLKARSQTTPPSQSLTSARPLAAGPSWPLGNQAMAVEGSGNFTRASSRGSDVASSPVGSQSPQQARSQSPPRSQSPGPATGAQRERRESLGLPLQPILSVSSIGPRPAPSQLVPNVPNPKGPLHGPRCNSNSTVKLSGPKLPKQDPARIGEAPRKQRLARTPRRAEGLGGASICWQLSHASTRFLAFAPFLEEL